MARGKKRTKRRNSNYHPHAAATSAQQKKLSPVDYLILGAYLLTLGGGIFWLVFTILDPLVGDVHKMLSHFIYSVLFFAVAALFHYIQKKRN